MLANVVLPKEETKKGTDQALYKTGRDTKKDRIPSFTVRLAKQPIFKTEPVTPVIVRKQAMSLLRLDPDYKIAAKRCMSAKVIVEVLPNSPFYILATNVWKIALKWTTIRS